MSRIEIELDDDVFDESFLKELDQLEEFATTSSTRQPPLSAATTSFPPPQQPPRHHFLPSPSTAAENISYSPPRQLSQRFTPNNNNININNNNKNNNNNNKNKNNNNNIINNNSSSSSISSGSISSRYSRSPITPPNPEIDFLKNELSRVSKQLSDLKEECSVLRTERDKKEQQLKIKDECYMLRKGRENEQPSKTVPCKFEAPMAVHPGIGISQGCEKLNAIKKDGPIQVKIEQKSVAIQTSKDDESASTSISGVTSLFSGLPKLKAIWSSTSSHSLQKKLVSKLLETCATDFCALFGFVGLNMPSKTVKESLTDESLPANVAALRSTEITGVSQLYLVLNKLSNDIVPINAFVDIILDLCKHENALVVYRSLRILRVAVGYLLSSERTRRRDNVQAKRCHLGSNVERTYDNEMGKNGDDASISGFASASKRTRTGEDETVTRIDWFHLFTSLCQTAVRVTEEHVKVEAVSIMNIILRGMNPYSERGQFWVRCVYEAVAVLLKRDAGFFCQKEVVHLVYLLLNCPNILATFCSSCKNTDGHIQSATDGVENITYQASCAILDGIADCILCPGHSLKELSLCRNAIVVMAFLASSGKSGLEIFLYYNLNNKRGNFLGLILQVLVLEIDAEALDSCPDPEISQERTLLIREALILLNRLVSHPTFATSVLQVLTSCRDIVSMSVDCATRLSKRNQKLLNCDFITKQMRESEVVDLASIFRKRIFTFLKDKECT